MGKRGPAPKLESQRRRRNAPEPGMEVRTAARTAEVKAPPANAKWEKGAKDWYAALKKSGQVAFYEPSDWAMAWLVAESISRDLAPQVVGITETGKVVKDRVPMKGASLSSYLKAMTMLMVTEADRRRAGVELELSAADRVANAEKGEKVAKLDAYRDRAKRPAT